MQPQDVRLQAHCSVDPAAERKNTMLTGGSARRVGASGKEQVWEGLGGLSCTTATAASF